jgi:thioredoxin 1
MMARILISALVGAGLGFGWYKLAGCSTGACPLVANWRRGALYGTVIAVLFYSVSGCGGNSTAMNQSTANVKHITDAEFNAEVMQATLPVVADFYATWCGPCRQLSPVVDALADQYAGKIKFVKVNVDESPKLAQQFQVEAIPTLLFFKDGKLADTSVGLLSKKDLIQRLDSLLQTNVPATMPGR